MEVHPIEKKDVFIFERPAVFPTLLKCSRGSGKPRPKLP